MSHATWDEDLFWFFVTSGGDLGMRGTALEPSIRADREPGPTDRQVDAAARYRRIANALHSLSHADQHTLRVAHAPLPVAMRPVFGRLGDLASLVLDTYGRDRVTKACVRKGPDGARALADLTGSVSDLASQAMRNFRSAMREAERERRAVKAARREAWEREWLR